MSIKVSEQYMCLEVSGVVIATARQRPDGWWQVTHWPRLFDRDRAITALTVTELLETGRTNDDPLVIALREELR